MATSPTTLAAIRLGFKGEIVVMVVDVKAIVMIGKEEGLNGYWKGNPPQVIRVIPYSVVKFLSYEIYKGILDLRKEALAYELSKTSPSSKTPKGKKAAKESSDEASVGGGVKRK